MPEIPSRIGGFDVVRVLGQGGMGTVYLGRDAELERPVAIKVLRDQVHDPELLERFFREARSAAALRHPNIITVYASGQHDHQPFIAMEFVDGESLADVIRRQPPLTLSERLSYIDQICAGLHFAHRAGIVHRDVKPANLMVDRHGVIRILDFGIARIEGSGVTRDGVMIGTLNYMSPEQMLGRPVDQRSDIFAVGAVAYELLCYKQAFGGGVQDGLLHRLPFEAPPPLQDLCTGVPIDLERVLARALAKNPDSRFANLAEMREALADVERALPADTSLETVVVRDGQSARPSTGRPSAVRTGGADPLGLRHQPRLDRDLSIYQRLADAGLQLDSGNATAALRLLRQVLAVDPSNQTASQMLKRAEQLASGRLTPAGSAVSIREATIDLGHAPAAGTGLTSRRSRVLLLAGLAGAVVAGVLAAVPWLTSPNGAADTTAEAVTTGLTIPAPSGAGSTEIPLPSVAAGPRTEPADAASARPAGTAVSDALTPVPGRGPEREAPAASRAVTASAPPPVPADRPALASAPPDTTGAATGLQDLLARVRTMYSSGDLPGALDLLASNPAGFRDPSISAIADRVASAAFDAMESAEKNASARSAAEFAGDTLRIANDARTRAVAFRQRSAYVEAGLQALMARDAFQQAAIDALARRSQSSPPSVAPAAASPVVVTARPLDRERAGIVAALGRFQAAYRDRDIDALQLIYPTLQREARQRIERSFRDCRAYDVTFDNEEFLLNPNDPAVAQVNVTATYACTVRTGQRPQVAGQRDVFILRKRGDAWFIERTGSID